MVTALGYGTTGLSVGQRVFGLADWYRDGTLAEYIAMEARNLAPLPGDVDVTVGASLPTSGLTAWQGLFQHGRLQAGQSVLAHGAAGAVGSMATQLAQEAGAYVIGTGRAADRQKALDFGANEFVDLENDALEDVGAVDLVFDVIGGDIQKKSAALIRAGGTLVTAVGPAEARPADGLAVDFVVESDHAQLSEIVQRVRDGRLRTNVGKVSTLDDAAAAFNSTDRRAGKTVIRVRPQELEEGERFCSPRGLSLPFWIVAIVLARIQAKDSIMPRRGVARPFWRKKVTLDHPIFTRWPAQYPDRLQLFSLPTPNGVKVSIMLEETGLAYEPHRIDITADESHDPAFLALNPNGKIPAIYDPDGPSGRPLALFESGAILLYLADKTGQFIPADPNARYETIQWVMWQMGGVGPMFGQVGFFNKFAGKDFEDKRPRDRYVGEAARLLRVLDDRLTGRDWVMGADYTIADMSLLGWIRNLIGFYEARELVGFDRFHHVQAWLDRGLARPAVERGINIPPRD